MPRTDKKGNPGVAHDYPHNADGLRLPEIFVLCDSVINDRYRPKRPGVS